MQEAGGQEAEAGSQEAQWRARVVNNSPFAELQCERVSLWEEALAENDTESQIHNFFCQFSTPGELVKYADGAITAFNQDILGPFHELVQNIEFNDEATGANLWRMKKRTEFLCKEVVNVQYNGRKFLGRLVYLIDAYDFMCKLRCFLVSGIFPMPTLTIFSAENQAYDMLNNITNVMSTIERINKQCNYCMTEFALDLMPSVVAADAHEILQVLQIEPNAKNILSSYEREEFGIMYLLDASTRYFEDIIGEMLQTTPKLDMIIQRDLPGTDDLQLRIDFQMYTGPTILTPFHFLSLRDQVTNAKTLIYGIDVYKKFVVSFYPQLI
tara:strand:+ start:1837 stop:2814 length:978 start_codon:yes stop_codon:yes gene_type:complete